jgi:hypothetical protein
LRGFFILVCLQPSSPKHPGIPKMWISSTLLFNELRLLSVFLEKYYSLLKKEILWQQMKK